MDRVTVEIPAELVAAAGVAPADSSAEITRLVALALHREGRLSLERAAELSLTPVDQFLDFALRHEDPRSAEPLGI
ncbi:MAG: UPF0175 family protein [Bryobacterales bacterium]|nr:UPF0175 family protein [Bryobacterales bacterium]